MQRPLAIGEAAHEDQLGLGASTTPGLAIAALGDTIYAVQPPGAGSGGLQPLDASGAVAGPVIQLPLFDNFAFTDATLGPIGGALRVVGGVSSAEYVMVDFDPTTLSFGTPDDLGAVPVGLSSYPTVTSAPGRFAITMSGTNTSGTFVRVIQQCE